MIPASLLKKSDSQDSLKALKTLHLVSKHSQMFYKIGIPKFSEAANGDVL